MKAFAIPPLLVLAVAFYVGMEHIGLYLKMGARRQHLTFGLTALATALYCGCTAFRYNASSFGAALFWLQAQFLTTVLFVPLLLAFVHDVIGRTFGKPALYASLIFAALAMLALFSGVVADQTVLFPRSLPLVGVAYFDARPGVLTQVLFGILVVVLLYSFLAILRHYNRKDHGVRPILVSTALYFLTILNDIALKIGVLQTISLSEFGILFLIVGMDRSLHNDIDLVAHDLVDSQERYRSLVEDSRDIIFALSETGQLTAINRTIRSVLGLDPRALLGKHVGDLLYQPPDSPASLMRVYFDDQFSRVTQHGETVEFRAELSNARGEPVELLIRMQQVPQKESFAIHGTAAVLVEDALGRYCLNEEQSYSIPNNLAVAEMLIRRLTSSLSRVLGSDEMVEIRVGLQEVLINAIEHGNLSITFEEKTAAMQNGTLPQLVASRRDDPRFKDRQVRVHYCLTHANVSYTVCDDGTGFDHRKVMARDLNTPTEARRPHGRGLQLARAMFDEISFNEPGNEVTLRKNLALSSPGE